MCGAGHVTAAMLQWHVRRSTQVTFSGRPGQGSQGSTLDVAGRRDLLEVPQDSERSAAAVVHLHNLQLVNLPTGRSPCNCRTFNQALMHWVSLPTAFSRCAVQRQAWVAQTGLHWIRITTQAP